MPGAVLAVSVLLQYMNESQTWKDKGMEQAFKRQYVDYARNKLTDHVGHVSANCSHQVLERKLSLVYYFQFFVQ